MGVEDENIFMLIKLCSYVDKILQILAVFETLKPRKFKELYEI